MIAYIDGQQYQKYFADIPQPLHNKRLAEMEQRWRNDYRISIIAGSDLTAQVDISRSTRELVFAWFNEAAIVLVDVQPADVQTLFGGAKNLHSSYVLRQLQNDPSLGAGLEIGEIMNRLNALAWRQDSTLETIARAEAVFDPYDSLGRGSEPASHQERANAMSLDRPDEPDAFSEAERAQLDRAAEWNQQRLEQFELEKFAREQEAFGDV